MFLRLVTMATLLGALAIACSGPRYVALDSGTPDAATPTGTLTLLSAPSLTLRPGQTEVIDVRFLDAAGSPRAGVVIAAAIEGTALDSTLGALTVSTDASGLAHASLVAGSEASSFHVRLSAREAAAPVYVDVGVGTSFGTLLIHAPYVGTRPVTHRIIDVVPATTCAALISTPPTSGGRTVRTRAEDVTIAALPTTLAYAVLVRANGDLAVEADGCVEGVMPAPDTTTRVDVPLVEVPLGLEGGYAVEVTLSASGTLEGRVHAWAESLRATVGASGGDPALLFNAIEAELVRSGATSDASALHMLRSSASLDRALGAQLSADGTAPSEVVAALLDEAGAALDAPTVVLAFSLGASGTGSMATQALRCSDGRSGTVSLNRAAPIVRSIMPAVGLDATFTFTGPIDAQAGALALAWADAVAGDRAHVAGLPVVLENACDSLESFAATTDGAAALAACDASCRASACSAALGELTSIVAAGAVLVDHDIDHIAMAAHVAARDDDGDALVDRLDGTIRGQLVTLDGSLLGSVDAVSGTLTGTRTVP